MEEFPSSELILNSDLSVYHLCLKPEDIADTIIVVGDPGRVSMVSKHFDSIELIKSNREYLTHTGYLGKKRLTVLSTGIGVDNIDIVFNELDALCNIDLKSRTTKKEHHKLQIIRLGTSGTLSKNIPLNSILISKYAIGIDGIPYHYQFDEQLFEQELSEIFLKETNWDLRLAKPYAVSCSEKLWDLFMEPNIESGITLTMNGFYAPQGRALRAPLNKPSLSSSYERVEYKNLKITNMEMETAGLYAFGKIFNHEVISLNAIIANRKEGSFSEEPLQCIEKMITFALSKIEK